MKLLVDEDTISSPLVLISSASLSKPAPLTITSVIPHTVFLFVCVFILFSASVSSTCLAICLHMWCSRSSVSDNSSMFGRALTFTRAPASPYRGGCLRGAKFLTQSAKFSLDCCPLLFSTLLIVHLSSPSVSNNSIELHFLYITRIFTQAAYTKLAFWKNTKNASNVLQELRDISVF